MTAPKAGRQRRAERVDRAIEGIFLIRSPHKKLFVSGFKIEYFRVGNEDLAALRLHHELLSVILFRAVQVGLHEFSVDLRQHFLCIRAQQKRVGCNSRLQVFEGRHRCVRNQHEQSVLASFPQRPQLRDRLPLKEFIVQEIRIVTLFQCGQKL